MQSFERTTAGGEFGRAACAPGSMIPPIPRDDFRHGVTHETELGLRFSIHHSASTCGVDEMEVNAMADPASFLNCQLLILLKNPS